MPSSFDHIASRRNWIVELDSFYPTGLAAQFPNSSIRMGTADSTHGLHKALDDFSREGGEVYLLARNTQLAERAHSLQLPYGQQELAERLFTEVDIPRLEHALNGGGLISAADTLVIGSSPDLVDKFTNLGTAAVWLDKGGDINGARDVLRERENVMQVTVPKYMFLFLSRARTHRSHDADPNDGAPHAANA